MGGIYNYNYIFLPLIYITHFVNIKQDTNPDINPPINIPAKTKNHI